MLPQTLRGPVILNVHRNRLRHVHFLIAVAGDDMQLNLAVFQKVEFTGEITAHTRKIPSNFLSIGFPTSFGVTNQVRSGRFIHGAPVPSRGFLTHPFNKKGHIWAVRFDLHIPP